MGINAYDLKRSVGIAILLTIVTCGFYSIYWVYKMLSSLYSLNNQQSSAGIDLLLSFVTCGLYTIYLLYKMGKLESSAYAAWGMPQKDDSILYLILTIIGLGVIAYAIIQSNLNNLADNHVINHNG